MYEPDEEERESWGDAIDASQNYNDPAFASFQLYGAQRTASRVVAHGADIGIRNIADQDCGMSVLQRDSYKWGDGVA